MTTPQKKTKNRAVEKKASAPFDEIVKSLLDVPRENITSKKSKPPKKKKSKKQN